MSSKPAASDTDTAALSDDPFFILGSARSGTSLLSRIINSHPRIGVPFESHLYNTFVPWLSFYGDLADDKNMRRLLRDMEAILHFWNPAPSKELAWQLLRERSIHGAVDAMIRAWMAGEGKSRWGEKTPWHMYYWREIMQGFPNAKFIHIVRDGRDAALSWKEARFGPKHMFHLARRWKDFLEHYAVFKAEVPPDQLLEISYEQLLTSPEATARSICDFLGEAFEEQMMEFHKSSAGVYHTDKTNAANLSKPLLQDNFAKWKTKMSPQDLRIFEAVAGEELQRFGYELATDGAPLSGADVLRFKLVHPFLRAKSMAKNFQGQVDGIRQLMVYLRLRAGW